MKQAAPCPTLDQGPDIWYPRTLPALAPIGELGVACFSHGPGYRVGGMSPAVDWCLLSYPYVLVCSQRGRSSL